MKKEVIIESNYLYKGKVLNLRKDKVILQNDNESYREIVEHNGGACGLVVNDKNQIYFVKQHRSPYQDFVLELPAGKIDLNEHPSKTIKRELIEEIGVEALETLYLGLMYPSPGYSNEKIHLYFVDKYKESNQNLDEDEFLDIVLIDVDKVYDMINNNEIVDAKTIILLLKCKDKLLGRSKL